MRQTKLKQTLIPAAGKKHRFLYKDRARQEDIPAGPNVIRTITQTNMTTLHTHAQKLNIYFSPFLLVYSGWSSDLTNTHATLGKGNKCDESCKCG